MSKKLIGTLAAILVIAAGGIWYLYGSTGGSSQAAAPATAKPGFEIHPWDHTMGNPKAKVVLIEYAALTCPICAADDLQVLPKIKKTYIDTGKVFYVFRLYPRMPEDGAADRVARCAPKADFFHMVDLLFQNQRLWDPEFGVLDVRGGLVSVAQKVGLSSQQVDKCLTDTSQDAHINAAAHEADTRYGVSGTPTFVVNGKAQPSGGLEYAALAGLLDRAGR